MADEIKYSVQDLILILERLAADLEVHVEELRQLDSLVGDGDLGITVGMISQALRDYLASAGTEDIGKLLMNCGTIINKAAPSTFGTLLSMAFMGAGKTVLGKKDIGIEDLVVMGQSAVSSIQKIGKATIGDKTLLDSLIPAVNSFELKLKNRDEYEAAFKAAVEAAKKGMEATISMKAKFGRASWHQEESIGLQDAGATAMYFIIESFVKHILIISSKNRELKNILE
jgi:dihydroxyacetone kinase